jgi:two-component system, OmpR family, alkaline phosphatase synthesis response regulator PhoP
VNYTRKVVLVVEDEESILELLRYNLDKAGFTVIPAASGEDGLALARRRRPDLILLDLMLPGMDGLEVCRMLKKSKETENIPVVMLTARGEEADIVAGLELGADDYLTKPFSPRVLLAHIRATLRRSIATPETRDTRSAGAIFLDRGRREAAVSGSPVDLTFTEFEVLWHLASRPGMVFTRSQIVDAVRGDNYPVTERAVDVQIVGLRRKLGEAGSLIETVRGVGYRFRD